MYFIKYYYNKYRTCLDVLIILGTAKLNYQFQRADLSLEIQ